MKILLVLSFLLVILVCALIVEDPAPPSHESPKPAPKANGIDGALALVREGQRMERVRQSETSTMPAASEWRPRPGSPLALFPIAKAMKYRGTASSLRNWMKTVPELDGLAFGWNDDIEYMWTLCQEHQALDAFVVGYQSRLIARWLNHVEHPPLETELLPVREFIRKHLGDDEEVWRLITEYSNQAHDKLIDEGDGAGSSEGPPSKWPLHDAMVEARRAAFESLVETLKGLE